ncbi:MAG: hypothetical protein FJ317_08845 [SAR202 cluster bacterium]|nr:hypothetical protein [SAR202 cluster bacterium]
MVAFGAPPDEAEAYAREWADTHGYRGRQHPRPGRGPTYIAAIKAQIPIEVVARELTELRQGRDSLKGRCPFHDDRDPSFVVWPARGIWRCYGACAEGGDIIRLWRRAHEKGLVR